MFTLADFRRRQIDRNERRLLWFSSQLLGPYDWNGTRIVKNELNWQYLKGHAHTFSICENMSLLLQEEVHRILK